MGAGKWGAGRFALGVFMFFPTMFLPKMFLPTILLCGGRHGISATGRGRPGGESGFPVCSSFTLSVSALFCRMSTSGLR